MPIKSNPLFNLKEFKKIYKKTIIPKVYYLKIKAPLSVQFELTGGCNQKCIFCYNIWKESCSKSNMNGLSKNQHLKIIDKLIENEIFDIIFSGGEPLLVDWLEELIKKASDKKVYTTIITNGILLNITRVKSLKKAGLNSMQISLHHYNKKINDKLTGNMGSFEKTVKGIKNAIKIFGSKRINVNMVVLPETYKDVYKMAKFLKSIGIESFTVGTPAVTGEMKNNKKIVINKKIFLDIYDSFISARKDFGIHVGFTGGFPICILPNMHLETTQMISNYCDAGLNQLVIDPEGNLKPCVCLSYKLGNILTGDIKKIWSNNLFLLNMRKLKYTPKECKDCKYISICRGGCRASAKGYYGKINAQDPLIN